MAITELFREPAFLGLAGFLVGLPVMFALVGLACGNSRRADEGFDGAIIGVVILGVWLGFAAIDATLHGDSVATRMHAWATRPAAPPWVMRE